MNPQVNFRPTLAFSLPDGGALGGVTNWVLLMARELSARGWPIALLQHHNSQRPRLNADQVPAGVALVNVGGYSPWHVKYDYLPAYIEAYRSVLPAVFIPSSSSGTYAACAALARTDADQMRVMGILHSDLLGCYEWAEYYRHILQVVIADSLDIENQLTEQMAAYQPHFRIAYRPHPVVTPDPFQRAYANAGTPLNVAYSGRIQEEQKRFTDILRVARYLHEHNCSFRLHVYGSGATADLKKYRSWASQWLGDGGKKIIWHGRISQEEMFGAWSRMDVNLMTSCYEGLSQTMIESMSRGVVPVVTRVSGVRDLVDSSCGFCCEVGDVQGLAQAIITLDKNRSMLKSMGAICRERTRERCDLDNYVRWFADLCEYAWTQPAGSWSRLKPTICMTTGMKKSGFDPGPRTQIGRFSRRVMEGLQRRTRTDSGAYLC